MSSSIYSYIFRGLLVACLFSAGSTVHAITTTYFDDDFSTGWEALSIVLDDPQVADPGPGTSGSSVNRLGNGGNTGPFLESTHVINFGDTIYSGAANSLATYNTRQSGAIDSIDFSVDLYHPEAGATAWQLYVQQDDVNYFSYPLNAFSENASWVTFTLENLTQDSFDTNVLAGFAGEVADGNSPDFSLEGTPLTFGYVLGNTLPSGESFINMLGVDNWSVTIEAGILPGDYDLDDDVDGSDFLTWQRNAGTPAELEAWRLNYGSDSASTIAQL
eukprot:Plantae.Rhodophyta-Hildenbrandia_rubra.ctg62209.p1 GENE.Plantae.Rhodophyta-Hildenbrandia_rubra.ctg62209~~Plantae.Rhodophyta-Hildenbrandia_rubra.ctg62209.p1  ORF type:complete len:274 (-),score=9.82 Plantae.Rhodophyta-Hildenbrandia_rubra.ctg62209:469-1290(-)